MDRSSLPIPGDVSVLYRARSIPESDHCLGTRFLTIHNPNARRMARYFYRETLSRLNRRGAKGPILNSPDEISRGQSQFDQR